MKTELKLLNDAARRLVYAFDNQMVNYAKRLIEECHQEEKGHRGWGPDFSKYHTSDTISAKQAGKLFAVKRVAQYLNGEPYPQVKDYLHFQKSCYTAAAMAFEFEKQIRKEWNGLPLAELAALNYTDFVKTVKVAA